MERMKDQTAGTSWMKAPRGFSERINIFPASRLANLWPYDHYVSKEGSTPTHHPQDLCSVRHQANLIRDLRSHHGIIR